MDVGANLPHPTTIVSDAEAGRVADVWYQWFLRIFARTGGGTGGNFGPPATIPATGSPVSYTATNNGYVLVTGGGVSRVRYSQDGTTWYASGQFYTAHPVTIGDTVEVTYVRAPVMTFIPA